MQNPVFPLNSPEHDSVSKAIHVRSFNYAAGNQFIGRVTPSCDLPTQSLALNLHFIEKIQTTFVDQVTPSYIRAHGHVYKNKIYAYHALAGVDVQKNQFLGFSIYVDGADPQ